MEQGTRRQFWTSCKGLIWLLMIFSTTVNGGSFLLQSSPEANTQLILEDTALLLASVGVTGLCHPTSNAYAPRFPRCSNSQKDQNRYYLDDSEDPLTTRQHRPAGPLDQHPHRTQATRYLEQEQRQDQNYGQKNDDYYSINDDDTEYILVEVEHLTKWYYLFHAAMTCLCVFTAAIASGLYIGLLSLDPLLLVIKMRAGESYRERRQAASLFPLVKQRHRLMVTLLIINYAAAEAMPVFLQGLVPDSLAVLISVIFILIFGEIIPTALFTGPNQIALASTLAPMVRMLMLLLYPITYPIARILDKISSAHGEPPDDDDGRFWNWGEDYAMDQACGTNAVSYTPSGCGTVYNRGELAALIRVQYEQRLAMKRKHQLLQQSSINSMNSTATGNLINLGGLEMIARQQNNYMNNDDNSMKINQTNSIDSDDFNMLEGALQLKTKTAMEILLSFHKVFCIPHDMILDDTGIFTIYAAGFSRVPVYVDNNRRSVKGILMTRQLMVLNNKNRQDKKNSPEDDNVATRPITVANLSLHIPQCVGPETNLASLVNLFQTGGGAQRSGHLALVCTHAHIANKALEQGQAVPEEAELLGIITLEDVLEALLQEQIYDEMDAAGRIPPAQELSSIAEVIDGCASYQLA